jgi:hypothetical protein
MSLHRFYSRHCKLGGDRTIERAVLALAICVLIYVAVLGFA